MPSYPPENHDDLVLAARLGYSYANDVLAGVSVGPVIDILPVRPFTRVGRYVLVRQLVVDRRGRCRQIGKRTAVRARLLLAPPVLADHLEAQPAVEDTSDAL